MKKSFRLSLIALCVLCSTILHAKEEPEVKTQWTGSCPHATEPSKQAFGPAIVAIVAPVAVGIALDAAGAAVEASANTNSVARVSPPLYTNLYDVDKISLTSFRVGCLTVAKGIFDSNKKGDLKSKLIDNHMWLEVELSQIPGQPLYQLKPVYLELNKFEDSSFWTKDRRLDVAITLQGVSEEKPFASAILSFPSLQVGPPLKQGDARLLNTFSDPFTAPELTDVEVTKKDFAKDAKNFALAMQYMAKGGVTTDYPYAKDETSVFSNETARTNLISYCRSLKKGESDSICANWRLLTSDRIKLQKDLNGIESSTALKDARLVWARSFCPYYKKGDGVKKCKNGDGTEVSGYFATKTTVTMVRDASKFGMAIASAITKSSGKLSELSSQYLPEARKAAEEQSDGEIATALANERYALSVLEERQTKKASESDINEAKLNLVMAMVKTNDAYTAAGKSRKHTSL